MPDARPLSSSVQAERAFAPACWGSAHTDLVERLSAPVHAGQKILELAEHFSPQQDERWRTESSDRGWKRKQRDRRTAFDHRREPYHTHFRQYHNRFAAGIITFSKSLEDKLSVPGIVLLDMTTSLSPPSEITWLKMLKEFPQNDISLMAMLFDCLKVACGKSRHYSCPIVSGFR